MITLTSLSLVAKEELSTRLRCSSIASRCAASDKPSRAAAIAASVAVSPEATVSWRVVFCFPKSSMDNLAIVLPLSVVVAVSANTGVVLIAARTAKVKNFLYDRFPFIYVPP